MTLIPMLSSAGPLGMPLTSLAGGGGSRLDPLRLFMDADIIVQVVMGLLLLASVWVWTIIISFAFRMMAAKRRCSTYEDGFWQARDVNAYQAGHAGGDRQDSPSSRVVAAALSEWRRSLGTHGGAMRVADRDGARVRLAMSMDTVVAQEADSLADRLNFLATVAAAAPFVGLFGTVWGIMNSFFQIGHAQNTSLAVVAPGISEALFATAIGLFAAIPALIAYNRYSHQVNQFEARLQRFADRFHASLSRELDQH